MPGIGANDMKDTTKIIVQLRRFSDPELAKRMGYTKNHFHVEAFMVGKWRTVGFYTVHQISKGTAEKRVLELLKYNARGVVPDEIVWQEAIGV